MGRWAREGVFFFRFFSRLCDSAKEHENKGYSELSLKQTIVVVFQTGISQCLWPVTRIVYFCNKNSCAASFVNLLLFRNQTITTLSSFSLAY